MKKVELIVYDVDGTLLDTREWILGALEHTMLHFGYDPLPRPQLKRFVGLSIESLYESLGVEESIEIVLPIHEAYQRQRVDSVRAYKGAVAFVQQRKGLDQAILTNRVFNLESALRQNDLLDCFDPIVTAKDVSNHKPHPEGLEIILATTKTEPSAAIYIGDGVMDMEAAKRAHMSAIGITHGFGTAEDLSLHGADHIVRSFDELEDLFGRLK